MAPQPRVLDPSQTTARSATAMDKGHTLEKVGDWQPIAEIHGSPTFASPTELGTMLPKPRLDTSASRDTRTAEISLPTLEEIASKFRTGIGGRVHAETKELHFGGDKGCHLHCYTPFYDEKFRSVRSEVGLKLLEIGVMAGDSLALWSLYFKRAQIFGVDIATDTFRHNLPKLKELGAFPAGTPTVMQADPTKSDGAGTVMQQGPFDIIIDDGSHATDHILSAFRQLFVRAVKPGGLYCIEDLEHWHLPRDEQMKRKEFFWNMIESSQWRGSNMLEREHQVKFINKKVIDASHGVASLATDLETWVETIEFHRQICCIRKRRVCSDVPANDWLCVQDELWQKQRGSM